MHWPNQEAQRKLDQLSIQLVTGKPEGWAWDDDDDPPEDADDRDDE